MVISWKKNRRIWAKIPNSGVTTSYLELFGQNRRGFVDVHGDERVDVSAEVAHGDLGVSALQGLEDGVVDENVLLLGLDKVVPLTADVFEEAERVELALEN